MCNGITGWWWTVRTRWSSWRATHHGRSVTLLQAWWRACCVTREESTLCQYAPRVSTALKMRFTSAYLPSSGGLESLASWTVPWQMRRGNSWSGLQKLLQISRKIWTSETSLGYLVINRLYILEGVNSEGRWALTHFACDGGWTVKVQGFGQTVQGWSGTSIHNAQVQRDGTTLVVYMERCLTESFSGSNFARSQLLHWNPVERLALYQRFRTHRFWTHLESSEQYIMGKFNELVQ